MTMSNPFERSTAGLLAVVGKRLHAFRTNGAADTSAAAAEHCSSVPVLGDVKRFRNFLKTWGPLKTHAIAMILAPLYNDAKGTNLHIRGFGLHFLTFFDRPFALSEDGHRSLVDGNPDEMVETLATHLIRADLSSEADYVRRAFELFVYPSHAVHSEDEQILDFIGLVQRLGNGSPNETTVTLSELDPIGLDQDLLARYQEMRAS